MLQLAALLFHGIQQGRDRQMRFANGQTDQPVIVANRLDAWQTAPALDRGAVSSIAAGFELHYMMSAEAGN